MDQTKIGKFIEEKRKERNMTQTQLAEQLGITDRAVSKWERGKSLPDASIMLRLCELLGITAGDLLRGEVVSMESYDKNTEELLLEMVRQKEAADKRLLSMEVVIMIVSGAFLAFLIAAGTVFMRMQAQNRVFWLLFVVGIVQFIICAMFAIRIEQVAGYYECGKCGHRYVPSYLSVNLAMHMGRTRYMKCPECGGWSWQKKVLSGK